MRHFKALRHLVLIAAFLFLHTAFAAADEEIAKVTDIQINGNKKVETETIRTKMGIKVGDLFSPSKVRDDIDSIYKMGYFSDVQVEAEGYNGGLRLIFNLIERPIVKSISFEGNDNIDKDKLREKVNLTAFSVYNPALVAENTEKIKLFYQGEGYFNVSVLPIISEVSKSEVKVIFRISEGGKVYICKVSIAGNEKLSSKQIKKVMVTKKHIFLWSWLTKSGTYKLLEFQQDMERIKALYYNNGYIQVEIGEPQVVLSENKECLSITIPVHEGEQFRYGKIEMNGNKVFKTDELFAVMKSKAGEVMNRDQMKDDIVAMTDLYGSKGYAFATVSPVINPNTEKKIVDVSLEVSEGDQIFIDRINISGNAKTRDKVIRRELKFKEGEIYDTSGMRRTYEKLKNLDFFEDVQVLPERKEHDNTVDLDVKVKEKPTGSFSIGGGYSTIDRVVGIGEITQNNFLGRGETLKFKGEFGSKTQNYVLSFIEPWLLDMPVSLSVTAYKEQKDYTGYSKKSVGGGFTLGKRFWEDWGTAFTYNYSKEHYYDVDDSLTTQSQTVGDSLFGAFDPTTTSKVGLSLYRDSRDNYLDPRRGNRNELYAEYAGSILASKSAFYKTMADSTWYFPFHWDTAFSLHGRFAYAAELEGKLLPIYERFYVGGLTTVRGYDWGTLGPKSGSDATGGYKELIFNAEYTFPLVTEIKLRGVAFVDSGFAYDKGQPIDLGLLRSSYGAGLRWSSPMGLIRLEYGRVISRKDDEKPGKFEFSMGTMF